MQATSLIRDERAFRPLPDEFADGSSERHLATLGVRLSDPQRIILDCKRRSGHMSIISRELMHQQVS